MPTDGLVRVAAMADVHYGKSSQGALQAVFAEAADQADVLVLCGDLTDYGLADEARLLARDLTTAAKIPIIAVLGNHDWESGQQDEIARVLVDHGVVILDGDTHEVHGVGFVGTKGFAGGFGRGALGHWGEPAIKSFVQAALDEALKLETGLARLRTPHRIVLLHYAPVRDTVEGEPVEIYPYLGSGRLEEPINRYQATAVFHGHAHRGQAEGKTRGGIPVYNVSLPLLRSVQEGRPPFRILEIDTRQQQPVVPEAHGREPAAAALGGASAPEWRRRAGDPGDGERSKAATSTRRE